MKNLIAIENINERTNEQAKLKLKPRVEFFKTESTSFRRSARSLVDPSYFPTIVALMLSNLKCARRRGSMLQLKI